MRRRIHACTLLIYMNDALQPYTPAVGLPQLTLPVRLCDYADCRKPLHKCARASPTAPRTPGVRNITPLSRPLAQETGEHDQATRTTREHACTACQGACAHADARSRLRIVSFASHACVALPLSPRSLTHTAKSVEDTKLSTNKQHTLSLTTQTHA